jgi:hypothetical protein
MQDNTNPSQSAEEHLYLAAGIEESADNGIRTLGIDAGCVPAFRCHDNSPCSQSGIRQGALYTNPGASLRRSPDGAHAPLQIRTNDTKLRGRM